MAAPTRAGHTDPAGPSKASVPVGTTKSRAATASQTDGKGITSFGGPVWPSAGSATATVNGARVSVGGLPLVVTGRSQSAADLKALGTAGPGVSAPSSVQLKVLDQATAKRLGVAGVVFTVARSDGVGSSAPVHVGLDYSSFANAFGANFGARLRLVELPACALTTPEVAACVARSDLGGHNANNAVDADVALPTATATVASDSMARGGTGQSGLVVMAATSSNSSADGTFAATSLSPAYSWSGGNQGGSFSYNYPLRVPPSIGGPSPKLSLSYDSGLVDAQTLAQNGQASWVGEGWDLQTGYIERSYRTCSLDGGTTPDLCWFSNYNATMVFNGSSVRLIRDNTSGVWHASADSALKIDHLTDTSKGNGDNDGEYWRVTTQDGTQYYFGMNKRYSTDTASTNSAQIEPVYGNNSGEPCFNATFANARCNQAYRWNLDYVVDPSGNSMTYFYAKSTGRTGVNNDTASTTYDYEAKLDHIDYGTRAGSEATQTAPTQVWFTRSGRCVNTCTPGTGDYPDTPWDLNCTSMTTCPNNVSPSFWTQYKLSTVYTRVWDTASSSYHTVDQWDLAYTYPTSGDNISPAGADTSPNLWLQTVTHTGYGQDGTTTLAEPPVTFGGTAMFNRVDWGNDIGVAPFVHYRVTSILNGIGGQTLVTYSTPQCDRTFQPLTEDNPYRCFQEYFKPVTAPAGWGWFNKYVVTGVTNKDLTGGSPDEVWSYAYSTAGTSDPTLWHHDYNETTTLAFRTWSLWQGYSTVTTTHGASGGPQTVTTNLYYRGMDGDGKATADNSGMLWNNRRVSLTTPLSRAGTSAVSGVGGLCLNLAGGGTAAGTNIEAATCNGSATQVFYMKPSATSATGPIVNPISGKCVDIVGGGTANGTNVDLWTCTGGANQVWQRQPDGTFKNPASGRCLEDHGALVASGSNVDIWDCAANIWNDVWMQRDDGSFVQPQEKRCLDIVGGSTASGTKVENWICNGQANQQWALQTNGTLLNPGSGKCIDLIGSGTTAGTQIQIEPCTAAANQLWTAQNDATLKNPVSGLCLDATGSPAAGTFPSLQTCNAASLAQRWVDNVVDADGSQGFQRETDQLDGGNRSIGNIKIATVAQTAFRSTPVTGGQDLTAHMVTDTDDYTRTLLTWNSTVRWTETQTAYNSYALPTVTTSLGDVSTTSDDTCTTTTYVTPDTTNWLVNFPAQTVTTDCATSPGDADYLSGGQTFYDGSAVNGATPTRGLATRTNALAQVSGGVLTWKQKDRTDYDTNGRKTATYDPLDRKTATAYTPASGAPVTQVVLTNPNLWTTTTSLDPGKGSTTQVVDSNGKTTIEQYDPLGRLVKAWTNNRPSTGTPDYQFTYAVSASVPNSVETQRIGPTGNQIASFVIYDGQLRERQRQSPTPVANGGRMILDTTYDSRGLKAKASTFYNSAAAPSGTLLTFADTDVSSQDRYTYDNLERPTVDAFYSLNTLKWQTTTSYQGDRVGSVAPAGGITSQKIMDARGNITQLRQMSTPSLAGSYQATNYTYDRLNRQTGMTDPAGNHWAWQFDLRGRTTTTTDPDSGDVVTTFDDAGNALTTTDARGVILAFAYDSLNRKTDEYLTSTAGTLLSHWAYDTLDKGYLDSSTNYVGGNAYVSAVTGYDDAYRALGTATTIPAAEGALAGTWGTATSYNVDGTVHSTSYPSAASLLPETVSYTYDANGYQLTGVGLDTYASATAYQPWGDLYQQVLGSGGRRVQVTTDEYVDTHRARTIQVGTENQTTPGTYDEQLTQQYAWDASGNLSSVDSQHAGSTTDSQCFGYDFIRELTTAWTTTPAAGGCATAPSTSSVGGADAYWTSWTIDTNTGNRTQQVQHGLGGAGDTTTNYTYPTTGTAKHTLSGTSTSGPGGSSSNSYTYQPSGQTQNATVAGLSTDYGVNSQGQLNSAVIHAGGGDQSIGYLYDADGKEILRHTPNGNTLYLGATEVTTNAAGDSISDATRYYTGAGVTVASRNGGGLTWQANDQQGTAQIAINATSLATTIRKQDPYGNARGSAVTWPNPHGFVNGTNEPTGLVHLGARMFDPTTGRFTSDDPVTDPSNPQQVNGYDYSGDNPTSFSDPDGRMLKAEADGGGSGASTYPAFEPRQAPHWITTVKTAVASVTYKLLKFGDQASKISDAYEASKEAMERAAKGGFGADVTRVTRNVLGSVSDVVKGGRGLLNRFSNVLGFGEGLGDATYGALKRVPWEAGSKLLGAAGMGLTAWETWNDEQEQGYDPVTSGIAAGASAVGAFALGAYGAEQGAMWGAMLGPEGAVAGAIIGGAVGAFIGSGAATITVNAVSNGVKAVGSWVSSWF